ncbi:MAG: tetratricopeptide repeat protein, partial [Candidatus Latescibacteria bacterium]|nr:tetratricopeptide repeat protein [Candidatus Latescibacterota bacterium]
MKRLILLIYLAVQCASLHAAERPTIAVLPFGEAKDRNQVKYLGLATASTLVEKLRRVPPVRILPISSIIQELRTAGIDPYEVSWAPAVATEPLGQWLDADILIIGAIGQTRDRKIADVILQVSQNAPSAKSAQIWLAARAVDIHTGETLRRAYVEGRHDNLFDLQHDLLTHIGDLLGIRDHLSLDVVQRPPTQNIKAYTQVAEAERLIMDLDQIEDKKREDQLKKVAKRLKWALDREPEFALAHTWQGALLALQNQSHASAEAFETAAKLDPHLSAPYYGLADLSLQQQDMVAATTALGQMLEITPWDDEAHRLQGKIQEILGNQTQALAAYERALDLYPQQHATHYAVGKIFLVQQEHKKAVDALQKAVDVVPGNLVYQIALADAHLAMKNPNRAKEVLESIASFAQNDPEFIFVRGKHALQTDRLTDAIADFKEALTVLNERADVHAALGTAYTVQSRFSDAIGAFIDAQSHGAALADIAIPFGTALEAQGQMAEAADLYQQALNQAPSRSELRLRLVKHLITNKKHDEAIETLKT